jgi:hypothetical protein
MGPNPSSGPRDGGATDHDRPAKRRRLASNDYDGLPLFEGHADMQRALRIEVLKIVHKDSPRVRNGILNGLIPPSVKDMAQIKARCKITVIGCQAGKEVVCHVDSQLCSIQMYKNPVGSSPMGRFLSIKPFHIPEDKTFLERDDDAVFGLAKAYKVLVEVEWAGDSNWPPVELGLVSQDEIMFNRAMPTRQWALTATLPDVFKNRNRTAARVMLRKQPHSEVATNFLVDLHVRWCTPYSAQAVLKKLGRILPSITVYDPNEPVQVAANTINGTGGAPNGVHSLSGTIGIATHHSGPPHLGHGESVDSLANGAVSDMMDALSEEELTPSRSRRTRQDINYNVRQMWNTAVGKETRKRRRFSDDDGHVDDHSITYLLPPEQVHTDDFSCLLCGGSNKSVAQLRAHYMSHPQYEFNFDARPRGGYHVTVTTNPTLPGSPLRPKIYQLGLPVKPLDLDSYVEGDASWVTCRLGPENDHDIAQKPRAQRPYQVRRTKIDCTFTF